EAGASSQQALLRALEAEGCPPAGGPIAGGHLAVALRVMSGARAGVTMEPAAVHNGLGFLALEEHAVQLWIAPEHRDHPGLDALGGVLVSRTLRSRLGAIGGYDLTGCGSFIEEHP
ncbi:MAG: helix-turn-helix protein, partial [Solirubrobacterales bacterium]|nr:helix-turn-helix protein [Solirubrobacterales bacterium]